MQTWSSQWTGYVRVIATVTVVGLSVVSLAGCSSSTSANDVKLINVSEGQALVQGNRQLLKLGAKSTGVWVDHRTDAEYKAGHIPGAISLPYERLSLDKKKLEDYDVIVVYGEDFNDAKAEAFSKRLIEWGMGDVRTLHGGMRAWKAAGNEVEVSK